MRTNWLAREVDDCRDGRRQGTADCSALADSLGAERHMASGVIALAKLPEAVVLRHSPVEQVDSGLCGGPRLPANLSSALCFSARLAGDKDASPRQSASGPQGRLATTQSTPWCRRRRLRCGASWWTHRIHSRARRCPPASTCGLTSPSCGAEARWTPSVAIKRADDRRYNRGHVRA